MEQSIVSAGLQKYINFAKGWQPRHLELNTQDGAFTTCHVDNLNLPKPGTSTAVNIRGATLSTDAANPQFTLHCADGVDVSFRCGDYQERDFWCSMLEQVGVRRGSAPAASGMLARRGSVMLAKGKTAALQAAEKSSQMGSGDIIRGIGSSAKVAAAGAYSIAKSATATVHNVGGIQLQIGDLLAEGGYSYVHTCEEVGTGRQLALKRMVMAGGEASKNARNEVDVLLALQGHPNIMTIYSHGFMRIKREGSTEALLVCELCKGGHLYDHYQSTGGHTPEATLLGIFGQCLEAVAHLHRQQPPIAHRDIKIENFLLTEQLVVKLCDFGSCTTRSKKYETRKEILDEEEVIQKYSTMMYRAPEMVDLYSGQLVCEAVDVWALGCSLFTIAYGKHPFGDAGTLHILSGKHTIPDKGKYSPKVPSLVKSLLVIQVDDRPTVFQAIELLKGGAIIGGGRKAVGPPAPGGGGSAAAAASAGDEAFVANFDDAFDPRSAGASSSPPPAANNNSGGGGGGGGGGGALFGMLDWHDKGTNEPEPQEWRNKDNFAAAFDDAPAAGGGGRQDNTFDPFAGSNGNGGESAVGRRADSDSERFEVTFPEEESQQQPFGGVNGGGGSGGGGGSSLFGTMESAPPTVASGGPPATAITVSPPGSPRAGSGGGGFDVGFDSDPFAAPSATITSNTTATTTSDGGGGGGEGDDFFAQAATPTLRSTGVTATVQPVTGASMDFFSASAVDGGTASTATMQSLGGGGGNGGGIDGNGTHAASGSGAIDLMGFGPSGHKGANFGPALTVSHQSSAGSSSGGSTPMGGTSRHVPIEMGLFDANAPAVQPVAAATTVAPQRTTSGNTQGGGAFGKISWS